MKIFKSLKWFFVAEKKRYIIGVTALIITAFLNLIPPILLGNLAELFTEGKVSAWQLTIDAGGVVLSSVFLYLMRYIWRKNIWGGAVLLEKELRQRLFDHYLKMDRPFFKKYQIGDLMAHATNDVSAVQFVAGDGVLTFIDIVFTGGITLIAMMTLVDFRLTILCMLPMPFLALSAKVLGDHLHVAFDKSQAAFSRLNNKTQESLSGIKVLKTFGEEKSDIQEFNQMTYDTIDINKRVFRIDALYDPTFAIIIGSTFILTLIFGGQMVLDKTITIGQMVTFIAYIGRMDWPMFAIGYLFNLIERGSASYDRIEKILNEDNLEKNLGNESVKMTGSMSFDIKNFQYPDGDHAVLKDIKFETKPGILIGIVGKVGSGKTSIMQLLLRQFDQYDGQILADGTDIRAISKDSYLPQVAYVPQDTFLFSRSIAENIAFAKPDASHEEIVAASKLADLDSDVMNFPNGYETLVGENGISLSGGQKQRLAIARALLKNSPVLVLDDALSAVDNKTEQEIIKNLLKDRDKRTLIFATHRLSAVSHADEILVMRHGEIIERGTHDELLALNGWYAEMWNLQQLESSIGGEENE
ncbi:MAG: ABC transporter transmembrane domain-containing protein [Lactobacillus sp.]|nr:ABC transporter transmembrane domain-containing protein [Lactobacillus sp.]